MLILDKVNAGYGTAQVLFDLSLQLMLVNVSPHGAKRYGKDNNCKGHHGGIASEVGSNTKVW